jgi:TonB family protein
MVRSLNYMLNALVISFLLAVEPSLCKSLGSHQTDGTTAEKTDENSGSSVNDSPLSLYKSAEECRHYGQLTEAVAKYRQARESVERLLGKDNLELARCNVRLATIYEDQHKSQKASEEWQTAYNVCNRALGTDFLSLKTAGSSENEMVSENNRAVIELKNMHCTEAISILEPIVRRNPEYKLARDNLAIAYQNYALVLRDRPKQALSWMRRGLYLTPADEIKRNNYDGLIKLIGKDPKSVKTHTELGSACNEAGDNQGAIVEYSLALEIDPEVIASSDPLYGEALGLLGEKQMQLGKQNEAEQLLQHALSCMEQQKVPSENTKRYASDLADIYEKTNKLDEANSLAHRLKLNENKNTTVSAEQSVLQKKLDLAESKFNDNNFQEAEECINEALPSLEKRKESMPLVLAAAEYDLLLIENKQNKKPELAKYLPCVVETYLHNGWKSSIDYDQYMSDLEKEVKSNWHPPHVAESSTKTLLYFTVGRFGDFSDIKIEQSSGLTALDDAAIEAFEKTGRARPLPYGAPDSVNIQFHFDYNVHRKGENTAFKSRDW